ncbi:DUF397 domain-containing protein [Streptomyces sp. LHD-70]|uniref:DUF397 domain-containing protein n=1 Tax=Streptomyces sp. LHD-70 TaxID=3072140 RepID=UPI00280D5CF3|nr:DUF397 domain-containing protein [Streptomyces sp. LHD-70]MDQ8701190.1 DUF397 domain-containing protein [Streptomyces sp. LHD-70]
MTDLYAQPLTNLEFRKHCGGNLQSEHESCVTYARADDIVVMQDSKPQDDGKELRFTTQEVDDFVLGYARERGLNLSA